MKRGLTVLVLALGALAFAGASVAGDGDHHGEHHGDAFVFTTTLTSPDTGTCNDNVWANDTIKRTYVVRRNADGSFRLTAIDRGTFTTVAGPSAESCNADNPHHGMTVTAGITGRFHGFLRENITGGTFNSNATCAAVCNRAAFVASFFGATAQQNLDKNVDYLFVYFSRDPSLRFHLMTERGHAGSTGGLQTHDRGDIATA